ncbi:hypothetical protein BASA50_000574 [Batrachochytrium salamandrivorans]|uniref:Outer dynein arm-docking complex subunit 4 n=1 Tax=Batrachochytrium salamandrivorans TaxID=1357716 RepID=A0ABQ8ETL5_9FUNG|nr:hypothetical protein BASA62_005143 [Batrachochytrium salamandrivorans]KAH6572470.1 hypothetical protein BASA60_006597 [Batrachochytrium salamandrivorans]KAH6581207.1 hypothetical protein BASA61_009192 [Batrachochytrium salamandrivorans]KAH6586401.1 hypothetical protein BASA50_000574 [Batrachochytrium salamandrivorans]KAH9244401.1 hypothetical protein BASA81_018202 [Batrachochytrium salamandrivorans]
MPEEPPSDFGNEHTENSIAKFQTLSAEGDLLLQRGAFQESLDVYTRALAIHPTDKHCLVSRSRCYIQIGLPTLALKDADASLREDPSYFKGQYQKAEALYAQSDFELALMYYHRGHRLRPELNEFRTGIQKAREAIDNSIGDAKNMRIYVPAKLRRNLAALAAAQPSMSDGGMGGSSPLASNAVGGAAVAGGKSQQQANGNAGNIIDTPKPYYLSGNLTPAMESKLLGELYEDKLFLQEMLNDHDSADYPDDQVRTLVNEGLHFLNTRAEFWRQQNPLYARKHEKPIRPIMEKKYMPKHPTHDAVQSETENRTRKIRYPPPTSQSQPSATSQPLPGVAQRKATA